MKEMNVDTVTRRNDAPAGNFCMKMSFVVGPRSTAPRPRFRATVTPFGTENVTVFISALGSMSLSLTAFLNVRVWEILVVVATKKSGPDTLKMPLTVRPSPSARKKQRRSAGMDLMSTRLLVPIRVLKAHLNVSPAPAACNTAAACRTRRGG